jgi:tetratricopeptide (TPR) repeat protein
LGDEDQRRANEPHGLNALGSDNQQGSVDRTIETSGGAYVEGNLNTGGGTFVGRDKNVYGDEIHGNKISIGQQINQQIHQYVWSLSRGQLGIILLVLTLLTATVVTVGAITISRYWSEHYPDGRPPAAASIDARGKAGDSPMSGDFNVVIAQFHWLGDDDSDSNQSTLAEELTKIASEAVAHTRDELASSQIILDYRLYDLSLAGSNENELVDFIEKEIVRRLHADVVLFGNVQTSLDERATQIELFFYISDRRIPDAESLTGKIHRFGSPIEITGNVQRNATARRQLQQRLADRKILLGDFIVAVGEYAGRRYAEAERKLQEIKARLQLESDVMDREIKVMLYFFLGTVAGERHDFTSAKDYYEQALELDETYARAQLGLAQLKFIEAGLWPDRQCAAGRVDEEGLQESIRLHEAVLVYGVYSPYDDTPTRTHFLLAQVYACMAASRGDPASASLYWRRALESYQRTIDDYRRGGDRYRLGDLAARAYAGRGLVHGFSNDAEIQNIEQAVEDYIEALRLSREPDQQARFHAKLAELYLMQGQCREADQKKGDADRAYQEFLKTNPGYEDEPLKRSLETLQLSIAQVCSRGEGLLLSERKSHERPILASSLSTTSRRHSGNLSRNFSAEQLHPQSRRHDTRPAAST